MPGLHRQPAAMPQVVAVDLARQRRAGPDEAHLAEQHVPHLGQLVEARGPQEAAGPREARIVGHLERVAPDLVPLLELGEAAPRRPGTIVRNLTTSNGRPWRPTRVWRKSTGRPSTTTIATPMIAKTGTSRISADATEDDIEEPLATRPRRGPGRRRATGPCPRRSPRRGRRAGSTELVERDADDLALLLAQAGDRLDAVRGHRPAGRSRPRRRPGRGGRPRCRPSTRAPGRIAGDRRRAASIDEVADDPHARARGGARRGPRSARASLPGPDHQHVAEVVAAIAQRVQQGQRIAAAGRERQHDLGQEQRQQEEPADVGQLEHEEGGERDEPEQDRRPPDVLDLDPGRPPGPQPVQAQHPQERDPGGGVDGAAIRASIPAELPARSASSPRSGRTEVTMNRTNALVASARHQQQAQRGGVASDQRVTQALTAGPRSAPILGDDFGRGKRALPRQRLRSIDRCRPARYRVAERRHGIPVEQPPAVHDQRAARGGSAQPPSRSPRRPATRSR